MKEFWKTTLSTIAGVVLAALVLGFFGLIYEKANKYDALLERVEIVEAGQQETREKLGDKIAKLSVEVKERHGDEDKTPPKSIPWSITPPSLSPSPSPVPHIDNNIDAYIKEQNNIRETFKR
jgi:hypothetical protein